MAAVGVDPEAVIERLTRQVGRLAGELAMRDVALDAAHARIAELEQAAQAAGGDPPTTPA